MEKALEAMLAIYGRHSVSVHWKIGGSTSESSMVVCGSLESHKTLGITEYEILVYTEASHKPMAIARFRSDGIRKILVDTDGSIQITLGA